MHVTVARCTISQPPAMRRRRTLHRPVSAVCDVYHAEVTIQLLMLPSPFLPSFPCHAPRLKPLSILPTIATRRLAMPGQLTPAVLLTIQAPVIIT